MKWTRHKSGDVINGYTLIERSSKSEWKVQHSCGRTYSARPFLIANQNRCRGCVPKGSKHHAWRGCGEIPHDLFNSYRHSAATRGFEFSVSIEFLWNLFLKQNRKCALTGEELYFNKTFKGKKDKTASPDRIDSQLGYVEGNLQWVHRDVNKLKKNMPNDSFISLCKAVANYRS